MADEKIGFWDRLGRIAQEGVDQVFIPGNAYNYGSGRWDKNVAITGGAQAAGNHIAGPLGGLIGGVIGNKAQGLPWNANLNLFGLNGPRYHNGIGWTELNYTHGSNPYGGVPDITQNIQRLPTPHVAGLQPGRPTTGPTGQVNYGGLQGLMQGTYNKTHNPAGVTRQAINHQGQMQVSDLNDIQRLGTPQFNSTPAPHQWSGAQGMASRNYGSSITGQGAYDFVANSGGTGMRGLQGVPYDIYEI